MRFKRTIRAAVASAAAVVTAMTVTVTVTGSAAAAEDFSGRFTNQLATPKAAFWLTLRNTHVPQGIAHWPGGDRFFVTYYDPDDGTNSRLAVHANDGSHLKNLRINGGHVGGVVAWRDWLYTIDTDSTGTTLLRKYRLSDIGNTSGGAALPQREFWQLPTGAGAFVDIHDNKLYFGSHTRDKTYAEHGRLYSWPMNPTSGNPTPNSDQWGANIGIPGNVQGLVVTPHYLVFSQSWDRDCWSRVTVRVRGGGFASDRFIYAPAMSEGIVNADGSLYVNFESGAYPYVDDARNVIHRPWFGDLSTFISDIQANGRTINDRSPDECDE